MLYARILLTVCALVFFAGCQTKPQVGSDFGLGFGMGGSGYLLAEKLADANAQVREKLIEISGDKHAECVLRFEASGVSVITFTKHALSSDQQAQVLRDAEQVRREHWVSPPPRSLK